MGFHFAQSNSYLLGNDSDDDMIAKSAKELLLASGIVDASGTNKTRVKSLSRIVVC